jgi:replicative DNA helicase
MSELHNADLELAVLGGLLIEPTLCADVAAVMGEDSIYSQRTRQAYATLQAMSRESAQADFLAVADKLETLSPTGDWTRWLAEVMRNTPSAANVKSYAVRVEEYATLRKLDAAGRAVCQSCHDPDLSISEKIGRAQQKVMDLANVRSERGLRPAKDLLKGWLDHLEAAMKSENGLTGLSTGFPDIDKATGGMHGGELLVFAARPKQGKTILAMNIAQSVLDQGKSVAVFSLEMPCEQLFDRMASNAANIPFHLIKDPKEMIDPHWSRITDYFARTKDQPLLIDDNGDVTLADIRARCRAIKTKGPLDFVVVDYLQLVSAEGENENIRIGSVSTGLKKMAKELNVPVLALAQMNRGVESRTDKRPMLSDLRGSGQIEQDADAVFFLHGAAEGKTELICEASRHTKKDSFWLDQYFGFMRFVPGLPYDPPPPPEKPKPYANKRRGMDI